MPYQLHITRKPKWDDDTGPGITLREWHAYIDADLEMRHVGFAEVETPDGGRHAVSTGLAVWAGYSGQGDGQLAWFDHVQDRITVSDPDPEIIAKMHRIAAVLKASVQGEKGEVYGADGSELTA